MSADDVTVAIPCYNVEETLPAALDAVERLNPAPGTVLCVDDGSDDRTGQIIEAREDVRSLEHDRNRGIAATINTALSHADTPLFAKIDADLVVPTDWLATIRTEKERTGAEFVQGTFEEEITTVADQWRAEYPSPHFADCPYWNKPINGSNILAETDALRDVGGWDEQYRRAFDDIDVMERLIDAGYEVYYTPRVRATHIRTDTREEVLRTSWAYFNHPSRGGKPTEPADVARRVPRHLRRFGRSVRKEVQMRRPRLLWFSTLRLVYHLKWDVEHVMQHGGGATATGARRDDREVQLDDSGPSEKPDDPELKPGSATGTRES